MLQDGSGNGEFAMIGAICRQDILTHPVITVRCFGWKVFFRALVAGHHQTFLSLVAETNALPPAPEKVPGLVDRCIGLELCAKGIYESLAQRFDERDSVKGFFATLADQEEDHAELLDLCRAATGRGEWEGKHFDPWRDAVLRLREQMQEAESRANSLESLSDALRLVIQIESSEVNRIYLGIVAASDSEFVRKLRVFHEAGLEHISYICDRIPEMDPKLLDACQELRDGY
jgi:hypothetical protein